MGYTGAWRSLVAHWHGGPGVGGSNPPAPRSGLRTEGCCSGRVGGAQRAELLPREAYRVREELRPDMLQGSVDTHSQSVNSSVVRESEPSGNGPARVFRGLNVIPCTVRVILVTVASVALILAGRTLSLTAHGLGILLVTLSGAIVAVGRRGGRTEWLHRSAIALEVVLLSEWIRVFSGVSVEITEGWSVVLRAQPLFTLAYIPVLVAALLDGPKGAMATAALAILAFVVRVGQSPAGMRMAILSSFGPQFLPLLFVAVVMGYLAEAVQRERIERSRRDAEMAAFAQTVKLAYEMHEVVRPQRECSIPGADLVVREMRSDHGLGGGDFCAAVATGDHVYWFCVADVAGRTLAGLASMPLAYAAFWTSVQHHENPEDCVRDINTLLERSTRNDVFVALFLARYDARTGEFRYCNAGQPDGLVASSGIVTRLHEGGPPAGAIPDSMGAEYRGGCITLEPGATVLLGTDGVLGNEELAADVEKLLVAQEGSLEAVARAVLALGDPDDDRGVIMLRRRGSGGRAYG